MTRPQLITTIAELRRTLDAVRGEGQRIGLVPTMGALHEGHLSLVRQANRECDYAVVSIFVNPTQFGPNEDFAKYPRMLQADCDLLAGCGTDLVFAPSAAEVYRPGHAAWVAVDAVADPLEGRCRPGHFRGVATVVLKLFNMVQPHVAYFGQKDYQQTLVIRRIVAELDVPIEIRVCPTVREPDGLAMSSRNAYLSPAARGRALVLWRSLQRAGELVRQGQRNAETILSEMRDIILTAPDAQIDYIALVDPDTLQPVTELTDPTIAALAVKIENTRLIDNCLLE